MIITSASNTLQRQILYILALLRGLTDTYYLDKLVDSSVSQSHRIPTRDGSQFVVPRKVKGKTYLVTCLLQLFLKLRAVCETLLYMHRHAELAVQMSLEILHVLLTYP